MRENFAKYSVPELHTLEGGKVDDPDDPGGRTNMGVTQRTYNSYLRNKGLGNRDVYGITEDEWREIMKTSYWDKVHGDELPTGIDYVLCDEAVNSGPARSIMHLQGALGIAADGMFGEETKAALLANIDNDILIAKICALRLQYMRHLKTWWKYGAGWTNRVNHVKTKGQALATGSVGPSAVYFAGGDHKALIDDAKPPPPKSVGDAIGTGGVVTTGVAQLQSSLTPIADWGPISKVVGILSVVGVLAAGVGFTVSWYLRKKEKERNAALQIPPPSTQVSVYSDSKGKVPDEAPPIPILTPEQSGPKGLVLSADTGYIGVKGTKL